MRKSGLFFSVFFRFSIVCGLVGFCQTFFGLGSAFGQEADDKQEARARWFYEQRAYPGSQIPPGALLRAYRRLQTDQTLRPSVWSATQNWQSAGPTPMTGLLVQCCQCNQDVSGRVSAIAVNPTNSDTVYCGGAFGGVWRSVNGGVSWIPVTEGETTQAMGSIAIDPTSPSVIYVGTGEFQGGGAGYYGMGVLKSTNYGNPGSWTLKGSQFFKGHSISRILVDPANSYRIWAATNFGGGTYPVGKGGVTDTLAPPGVWTSTNGGDYWIRKTVVEELDRAQDLVMQPGSSNVLYVSLGPSLNSVSTFGIYKTTNGGNSWVKLTSGLPNPSCCNSSPYRISLAVAPSRPQRIYSCWGAFSDTAAEGVYMSDDYGANWTKLPHPPMGSHGSIYGNLNYNNVLAVSPTNPNRVFLGALHVWKTNDALSEWTILTDGCTPATSTHVDHHALTFGPNGTLYDGNDGGVWKTTDSGTTWTNLNGSLSLTQFVGIALHPSDANKTVGGSQDNGYSLYSGTLRWTQTRYGDDGFCDWNYTNPNIIYGTRFYNSVVRSTQGGILNSWLTYFVGNEYGAFYSPLRIDPDSAHWVYFGSGHYLHRSIDTGNTWAPTSGSQIGTSIYLTAIAVSKNANPRWFVVGSNLGLLHLSTDNGATWSNITRFNVPGRWVTDAEINPQNPSDIVVTFSGFNSHTMSTPGHVFRTFDAGATWSDISGNLPDIPVNSVVPDTADFNIILVGTDIGVFITTNGGARWEEFGTGLPNTTVIDLRYNPTTQILAAGTHGRGMYRIQNFSFPASTCSTSKGDMNGDTVLSPADAVIGLTCVFLAEGNCNNCFADVNCDGGLTPSDVVLLLSAVFLGATFPC